jgi:hypothetical protein
MTAKKGTGRPLKFTTVEDLEKQCNDYFEKMDTEKRPYTVSGLALALKTSRNTLLDYEERTDYSNTIKEAKDKVLNYAEERLYGDKQVAGVIFNMKNNFGDTDKLDINADVNNNVSDLTEEQLDKKIAELDAKLKK